MVTGAQNEINNSFNYPFIRKHFYWFSIIFVRFFYRNEVTVYNRIAGIVQYLYDICLVRPLEIQGNEVVWNASAHGYSSDQLGYSPLWVFFPGAGQPDRIPRKRWTFQPGRIKGDPGSDYPGGVYDLYYSAFQKRNLQDESSDWIHFPHSRRLFYL